MDDTKEAPETPDHLKPEFSDRGFARLPAIPGSYGDRPTGSSVRVYESSSAEGAHIWLTANSPIDLNHSDGPKFDAPVHLTVDNAGRLRDQLDMLIKNHYQGD